MPPKKICLKISFIPSEGISSNAPGRAKAPLLKTAYNLPLVIFNISSNARSILFSEL